MPFIINISSCRHLTRLTRLHAPPHHPRVRHRSGPLEINRDQAELERRLQWQFDGPVVPRGQLRFVLGAETAAFIPWKQYETVEYFEALSLTDRDAIVLERVALPRIPVLPPLFTGR